MNDTSINIKNATNDFIALLDENITRKTRGDSLDIVKIACMVSRINTLKTAVTNLERGCGEQFKNNTTHLKKNCTTMMSNLAQQVAITFRIPVLDITNMSKSQFLDLYHVINSSLKDLHGKLKELFASI